MEGSGKSLGVYLIANNYGLEIPHTQTRPYSGVNKAYGTFSPRDSRIVDKRDHARCDRRGSGGTKNEPEFAIDT